MTGWDGPNERRCLVQRHALSGRSSIPRTKLANGSSSMPIVEIPRVHVIVALTPHQSYSRLGTSVLSLTSPNPRASSGEAGTSAYKTLVRSL